eukprot:6492050-Amphidinium_carterae.1
MLLKSVVCCTCVLHCWHSCEQVAVCSLGPAAMSASTDPWLAAAAVAADAGESAEDPWLQVAAFTSEPDTEEVLVEDVPTMSESILQIGAGAKKRGRPKTVVREVDVHRQREVSKVEAEGRELPEVGSIIPYQKKLTSFQGMDHRKGVDVDTATIIHHSNGIISPPKLHSIAGFCRTLSSSTECKVG